MFEPPVLIARACQTRFVHSQANSIDDGGTMTLPSQDVRNWTQQGSQGAAKLTYDAVKLALLLCDDLDKYQYEVFLQGSYANSTNTCGDSDVDVVVMLTSTFTSDTSRLSVAEKAN